MPPDATFDVVDARGRSLTGGNADEILPDPPSLNIHRADLHRALLAACEHPRYLGALQRTLVKGGQTVHRATATVVSKLAEEALEREKAEDTARGLRGQSADAKGKIAPVAPSAGKGAAAQERGGGTKKRGGKKED